MPTPLSLQELVAQLADDKHVEDFSILLNTLSLRLHSTDRAFQGTVQVRLYYASGVEDYPYYYEISHLAQPTGHATPYRPGSTLAKTEKGALALAISNTLRFIEEAILAGHHPEAAWLVPNPAY